MKNFELRHIGQSRQEHLVSEPSNARKFPQIFRRKKDQTKATASNLSMTREPKLNFKSPAKQNILSEPQVIESVDRPARSLLPIKLLRRDSTPPAIPMSYSAEVIAEQSKKQASLDIEIPVSAINRALQVHGPIDMGGYMVLSDIQLASSTQGLSASLHVNGGSLLQAFTGGNIPGIANVQVNIQPIQADEAGDLELVVKGVLTRSTGDQARSGSLFSSSNTPFEINASLKLNIIQSRKGPELQVGTQQVSSNLFGRGYAAQKLISVFNLFTKKIPLRLTGLQAFNANLSLHSPKLTFDHGKFILKTGAKIHDKDQHSQDFKKGPTPGAQSASDLIDPVDSPLQHVTKPSQEDKIQLRAIIHGSELGKMIGDIKVTNRLKMIEPLELKQLKFIPTDKGVQFSSLWKNATVGGTVSQSPVDPGALRLLIKNDQTNAKLIRALNGRMLVPALKWIGYEKNEDNKITIKKPVVDTVIGSTTAGVHIDIYPKIQDLDLFQLAGDSVGEHFRVGGFNNLSIEPISGDSDNITLIAQPHIDKIKTQRTQVDLYNFLQLLHHKDFEQSTIKGQKKLGNFVNIHALGLVYNSEKDIEGIKVQAEVKKKSGKGFKTISGIIRPSKGDADHIFVEFVRDAKLNRDEYPGIDLATATHPFLYLPVKELLARGVAQKELAGVRLVADYAKPHLRSVELIFNNLDIEQSVLE